MSCKHCFMEDSVFCKVCNVRCCIHCSKIVQDELFCLRHSLPEKSEKDIIIKHGRHAGKKISKLPIGYLIAGMNNERFAESKRNLYWREVKRRRDKKSRNEKKEI